MRSKKFAKRTIPADAVYHHPQVAAIINKVMRHGKKATATKTVYQALELVKDQTHADPLPQLLAAIDNIRPQMEVRARRIGGAAYQVPSPVRGVRGDSLAIRWLIAAARSRANSSYHSFAAKLAAEIIEAVAGTGGAVKKKLDTHRMAEANKAFAHFRW